MAVPEQLTLRDLNRATLARQHLLERTKRKPLQVMEDLIGLQSQAPHPPYTGLWSRIEGFEFAALGQLLVERKTVRIGLMRGTVHHVSAADALGLWPLTAPIISKWFDSTRRRPLEAAGVNVDEAVTRFRELLLAEPLSAKQLGEALAPVWPDADQAMLGSIPRHLLPVIQVPPRGVFGKSGQATFALLDDWLGREPDGFAIEDVVRRYLAAFGPATVKDAQKWSGLTRLRAAFDAIADELIEFRGPTGEQLYDLIDAPRPGGSEPAPIRLIPEWDNLTLGYEDRTRVILEERRKKLFSINGIVSAAVLVDGFVSAELKLPQAVRPIDLVITPMQPLSAKVRKAITAEAEALLQAMGGRYAAVEIRFAEQAG